MKKKKYTADEFLKTAEIGEVSMIDAKHTVSLLDEARHILKDDGVAAGCCKPILFSTPMVQAILRGEKTQTRRIIKYSKKITDPQIGFSAFTDSTHFEVRGVHENGQYGGSLFKMKYKVGDILWVRETFQILPPNMIFYKADPENKATGNWKPSIFMPKEACRIFSKLTKIRIERLQDITEEDAISEGVQPIKSGDACMSWFDYENSRNDYGCGSAKASYMTLWCKINGSKSWCDDPFVWVYEFELTGAPFEELNSDC